MTLRRAMAALRALRSDDRGNVLAIAAVGLPLLFGCAALAVDTAQWVLAKRDLQSAADSAAIAGVYGLVQNGEMEVAVEQSVASQKSLNPFRSVSAEQSPDTHKSDPFAVRVRIASPADLTFSSLFLARRPIIAVEAVATVAENGEFCAFSLGTDADTGIEIEAGANVEMECGLATNSSAAGAIEADSSALVKAQQIVAFGGIEAEGIRESRVRTYGVKQKDPLAERDAPLIPNTGCPNVTVTSNSAAASGKLTLPAGCYGNMLIDGPVHLADGEFILNRGNFLVGPTAEITCRACTIFLTSEQAATDPWSIGKLQIDSHAKVQMAAPTQGPNAGILFFQDRRAAGAHDDIHNFIGGSSFTNLKGLIYFPSETLQIDGVNTPNLQCSRFIGRRLILQGRLLIAKSCSGDSVMNFRGTEVRLIS